MQRSLGGFAQGPRAWRRAAVRSQALLTQGLSVGPCGFSSPVPPPRIPSSLRLYLVSLFLLIRADLLPPSLRCALRPEVGFQALSGQQARQAGLPQNHPASTLLS